MALPFTLEQFCGSLLPLDRGLSDCQPHKGTLIPMTGEAAWARPEGRNVHFVGHVKKMIYEFLP